MTVTLRACAACGHTTFPPRLRCHRCGGIAWRDEPCRNGVIEAVTAIHPADPIHLATIRTPHAARLIVRLATAMPPGATVALHETADGALWGTSDADHA